MFKIIKDLFKYFLVSIIVVFLINVIAYVSTFVIPQRTLAKMFVVSESLILQIREEGNNCKPKSYLNLLKVIQIKKYFDI